MKHFPDTRDVRFVPFASAQGTSYSLSIWERAGVRSLREKK